jgi:RNA polymerase sigma-70 factor (ECF subfamily)
LTDAKLISEIKRGNSLAFKDLVKKYEPQIAATVFGMLGNCPEAEDVGQETFIRFYKRIDKFRGDSSIGTYLTRIAINLSLNEIKRRKRKNLFFPKSTDSIIEPGEESNHIEQMENSELLEKALNKLEPKFRMVVVLRLVEGYSTKETARILQLPTGTVLSRLARAQEKLKNLLTPYWREKNDKKNNQTALSVV